MNSLHETKLRPTLLHKTQMSPRKEMIITSPARSVRRIQSTRIGEATRPAASRQTAAEARPMTSSTRKAAAMTVSTP